MIQKQRNISLPPVLKVSTRSQQIPVILLRGARKDGLKREEKQEKIGEVDKDNPTPTFAAGSGGQEIHK